MVSRKKNNSGERMIGGETFIDRETTSEFIGVCLTTFDRLLAKNRKGKLKFPLEPYQPGGPGTPMWFSKAKMKIWIENVMANGGVAVR